MRRKLDGIRVVDLSMFLPGPFLTMMMADHGAEVIRIESRHEGEPTRHIGLERDGVSVWFVNTHRGKKSLTLDLKTAEGREIVMRLAERSDVIVESFRPGVVDRLGIGYEAVRRRAPHAVYASISAFGQSGPYRDRPAHDLAVEAMAGIVSVTRGQDDQPAIPGLAAADMLTSLMALNGILMALLRRRETGHGDYLDVAMMDTLLACMPNNVGPVFAEGRAPVPTHERSWGGHAMYRLYATRDRAWIALGGSEVKFAATLLTALGRPDLVELCRLPPGPGQDPVKRFFEEVFLTRTRAEWVEWFHDKDVCFAPVRDLQEAYDDPQARAREMVLTDGRGWRHIGLPLKFRNEPGQPRFDYPEHGGHSEEILTSLGYAEPEIAAMKDRGVI
ncbi:MAG: CaiB/BaiF CoA transferase family protein [Alphaproteobacteria bacterium]